MEEAMAMRMLVQYLKYSEKDARRVLADVNGWIAKEKKGEDDLLSRQLGRHVTVDKTIKGYPFSWLPSLLFQAGEIGKIRAEDLIRHDFSVRETKRELDAMLTQAFCDPEAYGVLRSPHEEDPGPHQC